MHVSIASIISVLLRPRKCQLLDAQKGPHPPKRVHTQLPCVTNKTRVLTILKQEKIFQNTGFCDFKTLSVFWPNSILKGCELQDSVLFQIEYCYTSAVVPCFSFSCFCTDVSRNMIQKPNSGRRFGLPFEN